MANRVQVQFGASVGELKSAVDDVNASLDGIKSHIEGVTAGFRSLAEIAGVALSFEGLKSAFDQLAAFADQIQNAQARMGGSLESMTTLSGVATMTGVSFQSLSQDVAAASLQVQKSTSDAYGPAAQGLKALGLNARELSGLPVDQWFAKVSDAVSRFNPSLTLTSNVQQAFGRGFGELMPLLIQGSDHFRELEDSVRTAQAGLAATLPGISETEEKLNLLSLRSRAFAAEIFTALKPAIDAAIDGFSRLTQSITVDDIRDAANRIANALIDIAASVARFFIQAGAQVDIFSAKLDNLKPRLGFDLTIDGPAEKALEWLAKISGNYERMRDTFAHPINLTIGESGNGGKGDRLDALPNQLQSVEAWAPRAHDAVNSVMPVSGSWGAIGQDLLRLNSETLELGDSFTKLNAAAADNGGRNALSARATAIEEQIAAERSKLAQIKQIFTEEAASYRITEQQKALYTETAIAQAYQAELALIAQKERLYQGDVAKYAEVEKEKAKLTAQYQQDMLKTVQESQKQMVTTVTSGLQTLTSAFNSQLRGLLAGTTSWAQAGKSIVADMFLKMIELGEQWVVKRAAAMLADSLVSKTTAATDVVVHAAAEAAKTEATVTGAAARTAAETTSSAAGIGTQIANAITSVAIDAGKVFAGVFGFLAPTMGPAAAAPAQASAAATLAAGLAPLAVGAWEIPSVMGALLHPGEMVVPANFASGLRSQMSGGGAGGQGGSGATVFAPNFSGFIGTQAMINQIMPQLAKAFAAYQARTPSMA